MIKFICDKCGKDCGNKAYDIIVHNLYAPSPMFMDETGLPKVSNVNEHIRFMICKDCYEAALLPDIYTSIQKKRPMFPGDPELADSAKKPGSAKTRK